MEFYDKVLSTLPPSALPMHMNNHVVKHLRFACPFVKCCFFIKVYSLILIHKFGNLYCSSTVRLHARKRQKLYTKCLAQTIQTYT